MNQIQVIMFYVLIIAIIFLPTFLSNRKRKKQQDGMINSLKIGDKIITIGGIKGEIVNILEDSVEIKIDRTARLTVLKTAVSRVVN